MTLSSLFLNPLAALPRSSVAMRRALMTSLRPAACRRGLRVALLWLLAFVVPLQCSAALLRMAAGPLHSHAAAVADSEPMLRDFRREVGHATAPTPSVLAMLHGHAHPQRHHHRASDGGVTTADERALERADAGDDSSGGGAFAMLLPLIGAETAWWLPAATQAMPRSMSWAASSHVAALPERPPRGHQD